MAIIDYSLSFRVEADPKTIDSVQERLNLALTGQIQDLIAAALAGLEFDLAKRYWLVTRSGDEEASNVAQPLHEIPIWKQDTKEYVSVKIGSDRWYEMLAEASRFRYKYQGLEFTVRLETRTRNEKDYTYWRAYATVKGKLRTKLLGQTSALGKKVLDEAGAFFVGLGREGAEN